MIHAPELRKRLPALRRLAYLLSGSRTAADAILAIAVARLPRDDAGRPSAANSSDLYGTILKAAGRVNCPPDPGLPLLHTRLLGLDLSVRAVVLLTTLERQPLDETARICDISLEEVATLRARGRSALDARTVPRVMNF